MSVQVNSPAARDKLYAVHPMTNLARHAEVGPTIMQSGEGVYVRDDAGRRYLEAMSGLWCVSLGFGEQRLVDAAIRQMRELPYYQQFRHANSNPAIDLAEKLVAMAPGRLARAFFVNSGSEANDTIIKLVWYYNNARGLQEKKKIISRNKAYHGTTALAASLSGLPHMHKAFDLPLAEIRHTICPHFYRFGEAGESEEDFATRCAEALEEMILEEGPETVAAFVAEPVMGGGGAIVPPRTYFGKIQAVLRKYDVLFIADEVICWFVRTGNMFGSDAYCIDPDFMTVAKALSSAYLPIAGLLMTEEIYATIARQSGEIGVLGHGYTYGGHPVSAAVALETLTIYEERDILSHIRRVAPLMQSGLRELADHPLVGEVRGVGLIGAVELVRDKETRENYAANEGVATHAMDRAEAHGLITRAIGESLAFSPPLIISADEVGEMCTKLKLALDDTLAWVGGRDKAA